MRSLTNQGYKYADYQRLTLIILNIFEIMIQTLQTSLRFGIHDINLPLDIQEGVSCLSNVSILIIHGLNP